MWYESINNFRIPLMVLISCWAHYETLFFLIMKKNELKKYSLGIKRIILCVSTYAHNIYTKINASINLSLPLRKCWRRIQMDREGRRNCHLECGHYLVIRYQWQYLVWPPPHSAALGSSRLKQSWFLHFVSSTPTAEIAAATLGVCKRQHSSLKCLHVGFNLKY